MICYLIIWI